MTDPLNNFHAPLAEYEERANVVDDFKWQVEILLDEYIPHSVERPSVQSQIRNHEMNTKSKKGNTESGSRRVYSMAEKQKFFEEFDTRATTCAAVARMLHIKPATAQRWLRARGKSEGGPVRGRGRPRKHDLSDIHRDFVLRLFKEHPYLGLEISRETFNEAFSGLNILATSFQNFVKNDCQISCKKARVDNFRRNLPETIEKRRNYVLDLQARGIDYLNECIFIDEAGFSPDMTRTRGWAPKGVTPVIKVPGAPAGSTTILGAICSSGLILLCFRKRGPNPNKKRKMSPNEPKQKQPKGTVTAHFEQFISNLLDSLDKIPGRKGNYLVMDNAPIHKHEKVGGMILQRGYIPLYLSPYSPELNPIELYWSRLKGILKKKKLNQLTLISDIMVAARAIPLKDFEGFVRHSIHRFDDCLQRKEM